MELEEVHNKFNRDTDIKLDQIYHTAYGRVGRLVTAQSEGYIHTSTEYPYYLDSYDSNGIKDGDTKTLHGFDFIDSENDYLNGTWTVDNLKDFDIDRLANEEETRVFLLAEQDYKNRQAGKTTTTKPNGISETSMKFAEPVKEVLDNAFNEALETGTSTIQIFDVPPIMPIKQVTKEEFSVLYPVNGNAENKQVEPLPFIKDSQRIQKIRMSLVEPSLVKGIAEVLTFGANKYGTNNWKLCNDRSLYEDALLRHVYAYLSGEKTDNDTGVSHLYHIGCNLQFLDYMDKQDAGKPDTK